MKMRIMLIAGALLLATGVCSGDAITVDGKAFQNVLIRESASMYYVQVPSDGSVFSVSKSEIKAADVSISGDPAQRNALRTEWTRKHNETRNIVNADTVAELPAAQAAAAPAVAKPAETKVVSASGSSKAPAGSESDGYISQIRLKDVPLGVALKAMLRSQNLDYAVEDGYIWISTPERLRRESFESADTRMYELQSPSADTLPKIVLRNQAAQVGYGGQGYGSGQGYGQSSRYGQSTGGSGYGGTTGYYGSGGGGLAQRGGGASYGGGGYGGGGYGGRGMPMAQTGPHFSNIADLFTTIDDRLVGETPAVIGIGGL